MLCKGKGMSDPLLTPGTLSKQLSPVDRQLLCWLAPRADTPASRDLAEPPEPGWQDLIHKAVLLKVGPIVYKNIKQFHRQHPGVVPVAAVKRLQSHYQANVAKNLQTNFELGRICSILHQQHIPVILLKGSCLINGVYRDIGLRTMNDVDLLFRKAIFTGPLTWMYTPAK